MVAFVIALMVVGSLVVIFGILVMLLAPLVSSLTARRSAGRAPVAVAPRRR
ncbi:hypothetical protein [Frigoribacterium faeni]|uniref:Putative membrane protein n=1 Tax=Frigoribacterium faeni TaxID=145483 RepID=A0A7W3JH24_9MICO|nr:hypothetical protein [Frigoribacterium faeni]MBA8812767.1 putative membrane protein [Frigoribacterium faeni]BFF13887.1 hypothetical protein GCM10025699_51900 [Microbacterium flavescens]GEK82393.1 hypothetical protein FFA01_07020 [Frigoribacterium faeni]